MNHNIFILTYTISSVSSLVFDCRIPPPIEMNDMRRLGEIKPESTRLERKNKRLRPKAIEASDLEFSLRHRKSAMKKRYSLREMRLQKLL